MKSSQRSKAKRKNVARKRTGSKANPFEIADAFIPGASKKLLENPSKQFLMMGGRSKPGDPLGTIRNSIALLCDKTTQETLNELSDKLGCPKDKRPTLYEHLDTLIRGMAAKEMPHRGGSADKKKKGILLAIKEVIKKGGGNTTLSLWKYFKKNHDDYFSACKVARYEVFFDEDPAERTPDRIVQVSDEDNMKSVRIGYDAFKKHVAEAKRQLKTEKENKGLPKKSLDK